MFPNEVSYYLFLILILIALSMLKSHNAQLIVILASSYIFYIISNNYLVVSLIFVSVLTFYSGYFIYVKDNKKLYLGMALFGSLGQLCLFKYSGLLAPLGISYFTFMGINYVFDIYRGKMKPTDSWLEYALFISFFPVITSGPIIRARDFLIQLKSKIEIRSDNLQQGLTLIGMGLIMKLVIADNLSIYLDPVFSEPTKYGSRAIIFAALAFGIQLYCDFAGYSDIALGSARLFGFRFPMNFNNPYLALSPADFWHRWNISLSTFLRDYVYISLGGNRKGMLRTHINLIITMVLCGLWHGATWNFLIWGGYHGILLSLHRLIRFPNNRATTIAGMVLTQYLVFLGWLFFKVNDLDDLIYCLGKFIMPTGFEVTDFVIGAAIVSMLLIFRNRLSDNDLVAYLGSVKGGYWFIYILVTILVIYFFSPIKVTKFIYAGF